MIATGFLILCGLLVTAIAVKHASYILMRGSIFEPVRNLIGAGMDRDIVGFEKLSELFTCKVCMNTQVAIWLVALPLLLSGLLPEMSFVAKVATFAITTFSVSGLATWFWNISEYRVDKFEALRKEYQTRLDTLRRNNGRTHDGADELSLEPVSITLENFVEILQRLETACRGIGCGYSRRDCRQNAMRCVLRKTIGENMNGKSENVIGALNDVLPNYFRSRWRHKKSPAKLSDFRTKTYQEFQRAVARG